LTGGEAWPELYIAQRKGDEREGRPGDGFGRSRGENGDDVVFSTAAGGLARMGVCGAAWRGLGWPAEAAQEMVELHVQRVEAAERRGKANPWRLSSPEQQTEAAAADCLGKEKRGAYRWGKGTRRCQGCLSAPQTVVWGSRRTGDQW